MNVILYLLPIALGLILAYAGSIFGWILGVKGLLYFDFVGTFVFLMLLGRHHLQLLYQKHCCYLEKVSRCWQHLHQFHQCLL